MNTLRRFIARLTWVSAGALLACLLVGGLIAQQAVVGTFSRIYMGGAGTNNPSIRWGSAAPSGTCVAGSLYLQKQAGLDAGDVWVCRSNTGRWARVGSNNDVYQVIDFGAKCDGATDDTVAIQATIDAAYSFSQKAGTVVFPPGSCNAQTISVGPVTTPFQTSTDDPLYRGGLGIALTPPRAATIGYTAASSTITFLVGVITSADVGNYVFYGPTDATYLAVFGETRVLEPIYGCEITAILTTTSATCVATPYVWQVGVPLAATTGSHASFITNDHDFEIDDTVFNATTGQTLDAGMVGHTMTFAVPLVPAYKLYTNANRPGSHAADETATASPCSGSDNSQHWQCLTDGNRKSKYITATVTSVTSPTTGTFEIEGLTAGSNWIDLFPDYPVHGGVSSAGGGTDPNWAAFASHQWGHLVPPEQLLIGKNPHFDHYATLGWESEINEAQNKHTYLTTIYPYTQPVQTDQRYISLRGASQASSVINFTGCPSDGNWDTACPALVFSKNKYFKMSDLSVNNASGSDPDDLTQWGIYMGGLPGVGTQSLAFTFSHVGVAGFGVCVQLGDSLGGEISDSVFNQLAVSNCGVGVRIGPGSFNTLDLTFNEFQCGFNKIAMMNYEGNVVVNWGSCSFDDIDFVSAGFGPFRIENMRTEGPGIFAMGAEPGLAFRGNNMAEPQGSRAVTGDVIVTPSDTHTVTGVGVTNVSSGIPANSFYAMTFGAGDITEDDLRKIIYVPGAGPSGTDMVGQVWEITSSTTGVIYTAKSGGFATVVAGVTVTIYDTQLADITFDADAITPGDVGGGLALPDASVPGLWNRSVRCIITEVTSTTAGKCGFFLGNQGAGPVIPAGATNTDPSLFLYVAVFLNGGGSATFENNVWNSGMVVLGNGDNAGGLYTFNNNQIWTPTQYPLKFQGNAKRYVFDFDPTNPDLSILPTPTSQLSGNVGIALPFTLFDPSTSLMQDTVNVWSQGNLGALYGGPVHWPLPEGRFDFPFVLPQPSLLFERGWLSYDTLAGKGNPFTPWLDPANGAATAARTSIGRVKELSETGYVGGRNLRVSCTFATSDTCTYNFSRTEAFTVNSADFTAATRTYSVLVTSGHFNQTDVGKPFLTICCGVGETLPAWFTITDIVDATHIKIQTITGVPEFFNNGTNGYNATVGQDEPDAKYIPFVGACTNLDVGTPEVIKVTSFSASQIVLTSSKATSTAGCPILIVR